MEIRETVDWAATVEVNYARHEPSQVSQFDEGCEEGAGGKGKIYVDCFGGRERFLKDVSSRDSPYYRLRHSHGGMRMRLSPQASSPL